MKRLNAIERLRIHASLFLKADAGEDIPVFFKDLSADLKDAHVEHLTFDDSITALASLKGMVQILSDQGWELNKEKGKEATLEKEGTTITVKVEDETHVSIQRS